MLQTRHNQYSNYRIFQSIFPLGKIYLPQIESGKAAWHRGQEVIYWGNVMSIKINRNKKTRCYNNILPTISNFQCSVVPCPSCPSSNTIHTFNTKYKTFPALFNATFQRKDKEASNLHIYISNVWLFLTMEKVPSAHLTQFKNLLRH